jgi:Beta-lactamase
MAIDPQGKILGLLFWPYQPRAHSYPSTVAHRTSRQAATRRSGRNFFRSGAASEERLADIRASLRSGRCAHHILFTAVAVLQLVQDGKMSLDDPIGKFIPNYPNSEVATMVTVEELLGMSGSLEICPGRPAADDVTDLVIDNMPL